uniref:Uncharacterized protein n=1 Tax=Lotharella oceanica TaxID=641309 RepID=A0A7S2TMB5_9EUKA
MEQLYGDAMPEACDGLFDGTFYEGTEAVEVGLADQIGDLRGFMKDRHPDAVLVGIKTNFYDRILTRLLPGMMTLTPIWGRKGGTLDNFEVDAAARLPSALIDSISWK